MPDSTDAAQPSRKEIVAEVHEGLAAPRVELSDGDTVSFKLRGPTGADAPQADEPMAVAETMSISLESVEVEMDNQSFGMITAITGCASNVGGPSC
jgi:hypothetical protein